MKSRRKKHAAFVGGIIVLLFIAVTAVVYAVYFGYYHINGLRAAKYPIHGVDVEFYGNKEENPPAPEEVYPQLQAYLDAVEDAYGMRPMIYATNESWGCMCKSSLKIIHCGFAIFGGNRRTL